MNDHSTTIPHQSTERPAGSCGNTLPEHQIERKEHSHRGIFQGRGDRNRFENRNTRSWLSGVLFLLPSAATNSQTTNPMASAQPSYAPAESERHNAFDNDHYSGDDNVSDDDMDRIEPRGRHVPAGGSFHDKYDPRCRRCQVYIPALNEVCANYFPRGKEPTATLASRHASNAVSKENAAATAIPSPVVNSVGVSWKILSARSLRRRRR